MTALSPEDACQQAADYLGMLASVEIEVKTGTGNATEVFAVTNPSLLNDEQQQRYDELQLSLEALDRWPDTKDADGKLIRRGEPFDPHRKDGKLVEPYNKRLGKVLFGDDGYARFAKGGGNANLIATIWFQMQKKLSEQAKADPK